jgi:hypothetical protein
VGENAAFAVAAQFLFQCRALQMIKLMYVPGMGSLSFAKKWAGGISPSKILVNPPFQKGEVPCRSAIGTVF